MNALIDGFSQRVLELANTIPAISPSHIGIGVIAAATATLFAHAEMRWWPRIKGKYDAWKFAKSEIQRKAMRTQEAMDKREVRLREIIGEIISDGLLDREINGEISWQELKKVCQEFSTKMNMPDLVPAAARADIVKDEIKARFHRGMYSISGERVEAILLASKLRRETPPPLPTQEVVVVRATNKYWKPKPVAA